MRFKLWRSCELGIEPWSVNLEFCLTTVVQPRRRAHHNPTNICARSGSRMCECVGRWW